MRFYLVGTTIDYHSIASILYERNPLAEVSIVTERGGAKTGTRIQNLFVVTYLEGLAVMPNRAQILLVSPDPLTRLTTLSKIPKEFQYTSACHPTAYVAKSATINHDTIIQPKALIGERVVIGPHTMIGSGVVVDHGAELGSFVTIDSGAVIGGGAVIGTGSRIQSGAIIAGGTRIGAWSEVAAGSVVLTNIPEGTRAEGNPAKMVQQRLDG